MVSVSEVARMELFDSLNHVSSLKTVVGELPVKTVAVIGKALKQVPPSDYRIGLPHRITHRITVSDYRIGLPHRITASDYASDYRIGLPHWIITGSHHSRWRLNKCIQWISLGISVRIGLGGRS